MLNIKEKNYKNISAICVENGTIQAAFIPSQGAKLASLISKKTKKEYLLQNKEKEYRVQAYGGNYLDGECSGFDDMFPTISRYFYDKYPWNGIEVPDHGEVWSLKWDFSVDDNHLRFEVNGVHFPYTLIKRISFIRDNTLRIDYTLKNLSNYYMDYIWAAHMMFAAEKGCKMIFPKKMETALCTQSDSGIIGQYGEKFSYPDIKKQNGEMYNLSINRGNDANDYQKFYFDEKMQEGWGCIQYSESEKITVRFPTEQVPYFGAVQGEGGSLNINGIILEPCTGIFDRPDVANLHCKNSILKPKEIRNWYLEIEITND